MFLYWRLYLKDAKDSLDFLRVFDAAATIGHEKNNIGHRQDDRRGLCLASESGGCYLAEGLVDTLKCCAGFSSYRSGERVEEPKEKVRGSVVGAWPLRIVAGPLPAEKYLRARLLPSRRLSRGHGSPSGLAAKGRLQRLLWVVAEFGLRRK